MKPASSGWNITARRAERTQYITTWGKREEMRRNDEKALGKSKQPTVNDNTKTE
jgi:hypothetical protein